MTEDLMSIREMCDAFDVTPRTLRYYRKLPKCGLRIPRGYIRHLILFCREKGLRYTLEDQGCVH